MRAVNLLPRETGRTARRVNPAVLVALVGAAIVLAGLGGSYVLSSNAVATRESELALAQAELATLPRPALTPAPSAQETALAAERGPRVTALAGVLAQRISWDRVLRRFSLVLPADVWLQGMTLAKPSAVAPAAAATAAPAGQATGFSITGRTYSHAGVARLLSRLDAVPDLERPQLTGSKRLEVNGQTLVEFTIVAGVRADGAGA